MVVDKATGVNMHIGLGFASGLIATCVAQAAGAECFQPGQARQPLVATFADGARVEVLARSGQTLRYHSKATPTSKPLEIETFGGIFTLYADVGVTRFEFDWRDDLTKVLPLRVGQQATATADVKGNPPRQFALSIKVVAVDTIRIGACDYPVLKIVQTSGDVGKATVTINRFLNLDSLLTLRTERTVPATTTEPEKLITNQIVELE